EQHERARLAAPRDDAFEDRHALRAVRLEEGRLRLDDRDVLGEGLRRGQREPFETARVGGQAPFRHQAGVRVDAGAQRPARGDRAGQPCPEPFAHEEARSAACSFCRARTPTSPLIIASMPCTAAEAPCTVVTHGMPRATAALRISYPSIRGPLLPYGVLMTMSTPPSRMSSTTFFSPASAPAATAGVTASSCCLRTTRQDTPLRRSTSAVPSVATTSKPRSASRLTGNTSDRLSRLATDTNTVPLVGSDP